YHRGSFSLEVTGLLDMGQLQRGVLIDGSTATAAPGKAVRLTPGGLLTQVTNLGRHAQDDFTLVPEFDVRLGWAVTSWLRRTACYSFLLLENAARPGEQIDLQVNTNLLPGATTPRTGVVRPVYPSEQSDVWIQGASLGVELFW